MQNNRAFSHTRPSHIDTLPVQHDELDLANSIKGMHRVLDLVSEQSALGGLVDKIIVSQDSLKAFINSVCPGAYSSMTKVDFKILDEFFIKPVGVYGSKEEIVRFLSDLGAIDRNVAAQLLVGSDSQTGAHPTLRSGLYILTTEAQPGHSHAVFVLYWPEETTWEDSALSSVCCNRVMFMRYLTKMCDQLVSLISSEHAQTIVWSDPDSISEENGAGGGQLGAEAEPLTTHNCLIGCHADVWTRFPVLPAVQRETISSSSLRCARMLVFITDRDHTRFAPQFEQMIQRFERETKKPTGNVLSSIQISAVPFSDFTAELCGGVGHQNSLHGSLRNISAYRAGEWLVDLLCLVPIHIAVVRGNQFVPLKNGVYSHELEKSLLGAEVYDIVDSLSFGWYEPVFQSYMASKKQPVRVVSTMGKQSVGKSFAMNHFLDTSFAGSAMRTTEGVWMSVAPTKDALIVVLNSEGVHGIERSIREDALLVLFNTAISNLVLFHNNFVLDRDITELSESSQLSSRIVDPKVNPSLFQSTLVISIKDVVESDKKEITREFSLKFLRVVQEEEEANFISRLYAGKLSIIPWPVTESREFYKLFSVLKRRLDKEPITHQSAGGFLHLMKTLMAKLKVNDWGAVSQTMASHRARLLQRLLPDVLVYGCVEVGLGREPLKNLDTDIPIELPDTPYQLSVLGDDSASREHKLTVLRTTWEGHASSQNTSEDEWVKGLTQHLEKIVDLRITHVRAWLDQNLARFQTESGNNADIDDLERHFRTLTVDLRGSIQPCWLLCERCHLRCVQSRMHEGAHSCQPNYVRIHDGVHRVNRKLGFDKTVEDLLAALAKCQHIICAHRQKHQCEIFYANGHIIDAAKSLLKIKRFINDETDPIILGWVPDFTTKCKIALESTADKALGAKKHTEVLAAYAMALSLRPSDPNALLTKWAGVELVQRSINQALDDANEFGLPRFTIYRTICDVLEEGGQVTQAIECFRQMQSEPSEDSSVQNEERLRWEPDFLQRCGKKLKEFADAAFESQNYHGANELYSAILSLSPPDRMEMLVKRSKTRALMKSWEDSLQDADEVIGLDPSSHLGYERRHAALHGAKRYAEAVIAFDTLLSNLKKYPGKRTRELRSRYTDARPIIRRIIDAAISHIPRVLIDTTTGQLLGRTQQAKAFEELPVFNELVSSMTSAVDQAWIEREVKKFYQYVMFSHKWGDGEPLFRKVVDVTVYKLEASHANIKLQTFCSLARDLGFRWAWSDTCCIDKENNVVLQESLVAMFAWYHASSLTLIHLLGVSSHSEEPDDLQESIWNSRVWTYQEYVAAKRVLFYTEDWKPYLGLPLLNHKKLPVILKQMEMPQVSASEVAILEPGLNRVREKLYLASMRETTLAEDVAYSLLGILKVSIPIIYGEGTRAVGRLLEYVLTGSGDATILAWTGTANEYNSCLPLNLTVYNPLVPPHIPHMKTTELNEIVKTLRSSLSDVDLAISLYDSLNGLPSATLASSRLRLPGLIFHVTGVVHSSGPHSETNLHVYHATAMFLGDVEITTASDLNVEDKYSLVHPWIRPLLDQEYARGTAGLDKTTRALRLVARLKQQFGALLFKKVSRVDYKRVASDSLIMVQICDVTDLMDNIETIEVQ